MPACRCWCRPPASPRRRHGAIGIIRDEHRSLAAVMHSLDARPGDAREAGTAVDATLMRAIVRHCSSSRSSCTTPRNRSTCSGGCAHARRAATPSSTSSTASTSATISSSRALAQQVEALVATGAEDRLRATRALENEVARLRHLPLGPPGPRGSGDPAGGTAPPAARRLGGDRRRLQREPRPGTTAATPTEYRSCSRASSTWARGETRRPVTST